MAPKVRTPWERSVLSAAAPTPESVRTGSFSRKAASVPGKTTVSPRGLSRSEAIFATDFEVPTPMEQVTPRAATRSWTRWATRTGCSVFTAVGVTSMKASSMETCCTWGVSSRRMAMMAADTSR